MWHVCYIMLYNVATRGLVLLSTPSALRPAKLMSALQSASLKHVSRYMRVKVKSHLFTHCPSLDGADGLTAGSCCCLPALLEPKGCRASTYRICSTLQQACLLVIAALMLMCTRLWVYTP